MFYAIRKPIKAVYKSKKLFDSKVKELGNSGVSSRKFEDKEYDAALKWAKVTGLADADQQVVAPVQKKEDVKEATITLSKLDGLLSKYLNKTNKEEKKEKEKPCDLEVLFSDFVKNGYYIAELKLIDGSIINITLKDMYYWVDSNYYDNGCFIEKCVDWNSVRVFSQERFNDYARYISTFKKSTVEYLKDGILCNGIDGDDIKEQYDRGLYTYTHTIPNMYIPFHSIVSIKPYGHWRFARSGYNSKYVESEDVQNAYRKYLKSNK